MKFLGVIVEQEGNVVIQVLHIPRANVKNMHEGRRLCLPEYIFRQTKGLIHDMVDHDFVVQVFLMEKYRWPGCDIVEWFGSVVLVVWVGRGVISKRISKKYLNLQVLLILLSFWSGSNHLHLLLLSPITDGDDNGATMLKAMLSTWHSSEESSKSHTYEQQRIRRKTFYSFISLKVYLYMKE